MENLGLVQHQNTPFYLVWQLYCRLVCQGYLQNTYYTFTQIQGGECLLPWKRNENSDAI